MGEPLVSRVSRFLYRVVLETASLVDSIEVLVVSMAGLAFHKKFSILQEKWAFFEGVENVDLG